MAELEQGPEQLSPDEIAQRERQETERILGLADRLRQGTVRLVFRDGKFEEELTEKGLSEQQQLKQGQEYLKQLQAGGLTEEQVRMIGGVNTIFRFSVERPELRNIVAEGSQIANYFSGFYHDFQSTKRWPNRQEALNEFLTLASTNIPGFSLTPEERRAIEKDVETKFTR